jgi:hypothetical protein
MTPPQGKQHLHLSYTRRISVADARHRASDHAVDLAVLAAGYERRAVGREIQLGDQTIPDMPQMGTSGRSIS